MLLSSLQVALQINMPKADPTAIKAVKSLKWKVNTCVSLLHKSPPCTWLILLIDLHLSLLVRLASRDSEQCVPRYLRSKLNIHYPLCLVCLPFVFYKHSQQQNLHLFWRSKKDKCHKAFVHVSWHIQVVNPCFHICFDVHQNYWQSKVCLQLVGEGWRAVLLMIQ